MSKVNIIQYLIILLLGVASCRLLPKRKPNPSTLKPPPYLPPDIKVRGHKIMPNLRIPNQQFCTEMGLSPENQYMVLPWWYDYCQNLKEKKEKKYMNSAFFLPLFKNILDRSNAYKKMLKKKYYRNAKIQGSLQDVDIF